MDPQRFSDFLNSESAKIFGQLYSYPDVPRSRVSDVANSFSSFLQNSAVTGLFNCLLSRLKYFGETSENISAYQAMIFKLQHPFQEFQTEYQCLEYFRINGTYIAPQQIEVTHLDLKCSYQFFPLRATLKELFEFPGYYDNIMSYVNQLENSDILLSNVVQGLFWRQKKILHQNRVVLPLFVYNDDFETNNPLGSHRGVSKIGAVYVLIPCLPPEMQAKTKHILPISLYKAKDTKNFPMYKFFAEAVKELNYLEDTGITITTPSHSVTIHFSVVGLIGDNLAANTVLGFQQSFSSNYPCRFCLVQFRDIASTWDISQCTLRNEASHAQHLAQCAPKHTGVAGVSSLTGLKSATTLELCTVDPMHDILEGVWQYDIGAILYVFIIEKKYFTLVELNDRIDNLNYGDDEVRNKPRNVTSNQVKEKFVKMSAAESQCFLRNIGIIIGDKIPCRDQHWRLIIILKEIYDIVTATSVQNGLHEYLSDLISNYLRLLVTLFGNYLKLKHHILLHYAALMKQLGPLRYLSTMRCESKNKDMKGCIKTSLSRVNPCKTIAMKCQLQANYRKQLNLSIEKELSYEIGKSVGIAAERLPEYPYFSHLLPILPKKEVLVINNLRFRGREIRDGVIVMLPCDSSVNFFLVHKIVIDESKMYLISRNVTDFSYYDEHYQAYNLDPNHLSGLQTWQILTIQDLKFRFISRTVKNARGDVFIPKRWI